MAIVSIIVFYSSDELVCTSERESSLISYDAMDIFEQRKTEEDKSEKRGREREPE